MSLLPENEQPSFAEFCEVAYDDEVSSDDGDASNSDAEAEIEDSDSNEESVQETFPPGQIVPGRRWEEVAPGSKDHNLSRTCSLTSKSEQVETVDDCFHLFINDEIIHQIILYTNKKAVSDLPENKPWKPVDRIEMDAFFGLLLLMGRYRESREGLQDLWRSNEGLSRRYYAAVMARERFSSILRYIRFDESATRKQRRLYDKLAPLRDFMDTFTDNCKSSYDAGDMGCVDDQLKIFRGRCSFKVKIPAKRRPCGIKIWTHCDAQNFYCCNIDVYLGTQGKAPEQQQGKRVVRKLVDFWAGSGRCVTMNNYYADISLAEELLQKNIFSVGAIKENKADLPKTLVDTRYRKQYSSQFLFTNDLTLVSYMPKPGEKVILLSTLHHEPNISMASTKPEPAIVEYYNSTKNGVDTLDKILTEHSCRRSTSRWPLSLFMHCIDIAAYNAFVIWQLKYPAWCDKSSIKERRKTFLEDLACKLTAKHIDRRATEFENNLTQLHKSSLNAIEATGRIIAKKVKLGTQPRARCCFCIGSNNKYSNKCDCCARHVCGKHSAQSKKVLCMNCHDINTELE